MTPEPVRHGLPRASLCLLALAWVVPFLQPYHRFPITAFYGEWLALALGLAALVPLLFSRSWRDADIPVVALAFLGLTLVLGLQVALKRVNYPEQALVAALYLVWAALLVMLGRALRRVLGLVAIADVLAWSLLAGALLNAVAGLIQLYDVAGPFSFLFADPQPPGTYGNLHQRNHFAAYVAMGVACAGYLCARGLLPALWAGACVLFLMLALGLSASRSPWLYLACFTLLGLILHGVRRDAESRRLAVYSLALWPVFALAQWACTLPFLQPEYELRTSVQRLFDMGGNIESRVQFARGAWRMFLDAPVLGAGWGQFAWQHFLYLSSTEGAIEPHIVNHAHNIVLQLLAETGIAGTGLFAGAAVIWFADSRRAPFDLASWWLLALLAVIGVHSLLEFPLWYAYFLGVAAVLAGLGSHTAIPVRRYGAARIITALFVLSGAVNLAAVLAPYREFEHLMFDPRRGAAQSMTDTKFAEAITRLRGEPVLAPYVELAIVLGMEVSSDRLPEKLDLATRAMHFAPATPVVLRHALLLALAKDGAGAAREVESVVRVYPGDEDDVVRELARAAPANPGEFTPLLELATARRAQHVGAGALADDALRR